MTGRRLKIDSIIFDMDGVITNTMPDHFRAWKKIFGDLGIHVTHLDIYTREGQKGIDSVQEIFREKGKPFTRKCAHRILKEKEALFKRIVKQRFINGARSFLHDLDEKGFRLALVTGTSRHELKKMLPDRLDRLFSVIITGSDVKNGKPHPEPYRKALARLKIQARRAIALENAPFGIRSAKGAGLRCFAIETSLPKEYLKEAEGVFASIDDLKRHVKFINEGSVSKQS